jgi:DNA repair protein RecN (Recombination protein N)
MLTELHIENLGVIERAVLVLGGGLTALTGETGAGKTMLVEAIDLLVGGRSDAAVVRAGADEARIDGRVEVRRGELTEEIVLTRVIPATGRSRAYVNGRPATVSTLAELTSEVIDLHGQHAHQSLLSTATQRAALDEFGEIDLAPLQSARARLTELDAELATLGGDEKARAREIDLLRFQVAELDAAGVRDAEEDTRLAREESLLSDALAHREAGQAALEQLRGDGGAGDTMADAITALGGREPYDDLISRLRGLSAELDELVRDLRDRTEQIDEDPDRLAEIRARRQLLSDLRRKYGDDLSEVMAFHAAAEHRLRELEDYDRRAAQLDLERGRAVEAERAAAKVVGTRRRAVAPMLASAVEEGLRSLAMPNAAIGIEIGNGPDDHPGDAVKFLLSANPGSPMQPLSRVASGGELARSMLALRLVLSGAGDHAGASTLVFDEVDAGIGGSAAAAVGKALADLGDHHQVLVVTHLPQVAACATRQLMVSKVVQDGATYASVEAVDGDRRVVEIARMLAGSDTPAAVEHARDLLGA